MKDQAKPNSPPPPKEKPARFPGAPTGKEEIRDPVRSETALSPDTVDDELDKEEEHEETGPDGIQSDSNEEEPDPALRKSDT